MMLMMVMIIISALVMEAVDACDKPYARDAH